MRCKICQNDTKLIKTLRILESYNADYYLCPKCNFMFVGNPTWLSEAYKSPIKITDTGHVTRNIYLSRKTLILFYILFGKNWNYLDYAGGYGMLTRLMRDYGFEYLTDDPYTSNLFAKGFEYKNENIKAITCFEGFEHFDNPNAEIEKMFSISKNIFFSTVLFSGEEAPDDDWDYYGLNHGQHIAFYSIKTLEYIANKYKVNLYTNHTNLHLFTTKKISNWYFNFLFSLTKLQFDLFLKKISKSKTVSDNLELKKKGFI